MVAHFSTGILAHFSISIYTTGQAGSGRCAEQAGAIFRKCTAADTQSIGKYYPQSHHNWASGAVCQGGNPVQRIENITLGILSEVLIRAIPKGLKVNFILSASIYRMATAFFSFWAALIKIYSYFRLYTFMSIYVKNSC